MPYYQQAIAMAHRLEEPLLLAVAALTQAQAASDPVEAEAAFKQYFAFMQQVPLDPQLSMQIGTTHGLFGDFLRENGRYQEAEIQYKKSLAVIDKINDSRPWLLPVGNLGRLDLQAGRLQEAHEKFSLCVAGARQTDRRMPLADWLLRLGESWLYLGNLAEAASCLQENISLCQEMGNPHSQADALVTLGQVVMLQGDMASAIQHLGTGFALYQGIYEQQRAASFIGGRVIKPELVDSVWRAGLVAVAQARYEQAALVFGMAEGLQQKINHIPVLPLQAMIDEGVTAVRHNLPPTIIVAAQEKGQQLSVGAILAELATVEWSGTAPLQ
jgi:tetratricopeptide (TPR) repeat protein